MLKARLPYKLQLLLSHIYNFIKAIPNMLRYIFKDFSNLEMIGSNISLDASSICQLKCPICPTSKEFNKKGPVGWGYLKFNDFKNFIMHNPWIKNIELSCWGEIFLNPDLEQILKLAYDKKINLTVNGGANLNSVKKDVLESLVKYKLSSLNVSLDGATNETYKVYRKGGDLNIVLKNINTINFFKKKYGSNYPKLFWQFIIMGHNEHELSTARKMAYNLGMEFFTKLNREPSYSPIRNENLVRNESRLGVISRDDFFYKYKKIYIPNCVRLWTSPQINWDGKLLGCSDNIWTSFGNVFEKGLKPCLNDERYIYTKQIILGKKKARNDTPCFKCHKYKYIKKIPIQKKDILLNIVKM